MNQVYRLLQSSLIIFILFFNCILLSANPAYDARKNQYIQDALANPNSDAITIQAYKGIPLDSVAFNTLLENLKNRETADFDIVKLIRVLFFTHGTYDTQILEVLKPIPFWLQKGEILRQYWSENHMIMWMSSDWLLHEKYGKEIDSTLEKRLRHYLQLKIQYGFYEFFSSVYSPYCLSGLLNLADFSEDAEIKSLATQAAQRLMKELLLLTNDKGVFFPAAGRNYYGKYATPFLQNHNHLIYLLMGMGQQPISASHAAGFLATSSIPVDNVIQSWTPVLNTVYTIGHSLKEGVNTINKDMSKNDKVIFQWSSGAYFHPDIAPATFQFLKDFDMWGHPEFKDFKQFSGLPTELATAAATIAASISRSSVICGQDVAIFKNKSVTLSSIQDFWKGKNGYQQFPVVANTGTTAVFTLSGKVNTRWDDRPDIHANTHLPYVQQKDNIALIMYRPEKGLALFGYQDEKLDVALHFQTEKMDEVRENGAWLIGREGDSYVAVRRSCNGTINNIPACDNPDGQTWVIIVGNIDMYGSFDAFEGKLSQAQYEEKWYFNLPTLQWVYYSKIVVDGKTLEYAWNGDILSGPTRTTTAIQSQRTTNTLAVFPNPAKDNFSIDFSDLKERATLRIVNIVGQEMYLEKIDKQTSAIKAIDTATWPNGLYLIELETSEGISTSKLQIQR